MCIDSSGVFAVTGGTRISNVYIWTLKVDSSLLMPVWDTLYGTSSNIEMGYDIFTDESGNYLIAASGSNLGLSDAWILKLN